MKRARLLPAIGAALSLLVGYVAVFGMHLPVGRSADASAAFVAYRGPHAIGDMIGSNAKVAAVDGAGRPTAVVSTNGKTPVVWTFEMQSPTMLKPITGRRVHRFDSDLWLHPACPSSICHAAAPGRPIRTPPPALDVDVCRALPPAELIALLGPGRGAFSESSPAAGTCVWDNGRAGVQIEVGGPEWWDYLLALPGLYRSGVKGADELVDATDGLHIAVRHGSVTVVLLTYANTSAPGWARIARKVATWATSG